MCRGIFRIVRLGARVVVASLLLGVATAHVAGAQYARADDWTTLLEHEGVAFRFVFYSTADTYNDGVVLLLHNQNDHPVHYRFRIVFRTADGEEHVEAVEGGLDADEIVTGDRAGLFFIPFEDGRSIGEVGLRGYSVSGIDG